VENVPVDYQDFASEADEHAHLIADNRIAELAEIDGNELAGLLRQLDGQIDMELTGFDQVSLDDLLANTTSDQPEVDAEPQIDKADELQAKWKTAMGQVWELGDHRLLCGDSTISDNARKLMNGQSATAVVTDPPYGIGPKMQGGTWATKNSQYAEMQTWDTNADPKYIESVLGMGVPSIIWGGNYFNLPPSRCWLVWNKPHFPTMSDCELAWTNMDKNTKRIDSPRVHQTDGKKKHPTQKPLAVIDWAIGLLPESGGIVYDPFLGSGTTLMACENLNRKCYGIELDPGYVAVTLERWAEATGKEPKLCN